MNISSFQAPQEFLIVGAAVEIGLFDAVKENPVNLENLCTQLDVNHRALWTVVEALVALEYLEYQGDAIKLTPQAYSVFYNTEYEQYIGFSFMHAYNLIASWIHLPTVIKSGQPVAKKKSEHTKHFINAMSHYAKRSASQVVEYCLKNLPPQPRVLDVGGGPLTYALAFAKKGARVTVLDLPTVIDMMTPQLDYQYPINMVRGDFTKGLPAGPFELVYLGNVCHIYGEAENRKLFKDAANELVTGGQIIINDMIRGTGQRAAIFAVNMLVNTPSGGTWTYQQYKTWLEDAGMKVFPYQLVSGRQLIKAEKR